jgi:hypothetical protein
MSERNHLFLVSSPRIIHSRKRPITYLFVVNAGCPPEALEYENWGLVERGNASETDIVRGGFDAARMDLGSRVPEHEWRISVGNSNGVLMQEKLLEEDSGDSALRSIVRRLPPSVLLIQEALVEAFTAACDETQVTYKVHVNKELLCADCLQFGCNGCDKKAKEETEGLEGTKFHLA